VRRWRKLGWVCAVPLLAGAAGAAERPVESRAPLVSASAAQAHFELGLMHHEQLFQSLDRAIAEYERAVRAQPDYAEAQYHLGVAYHTKAKLQMEDKRLYRRALAAYESYLKHAPRGPLRTRARQNLRVVRSRLR
jgi:tetratricopeptide (TPR) repeat protein